MQTATAEFDLLGGWQGRRYQMNAWYALERGFNRLSIIWPRRAGKDEFAMRKTCVKALERIGNYWHFVPEKEQARTALWDAVNPHTGRRRIDECFPKEVRKNTTKDRMQIEFVNGSTWQLLGSDNFDALVGAPPVGLIFSEWALAKAEAWSILSPMIIENGGWAMFVTTPRGRNHAHTMHEAGGANPKWFCELLTVEDTKHVSEDDLQQDLQEKVALYGEDMGRALWYQEWYCTFDAPSDKAFIPSHIVTRAVDRVLPHGAADGRERVIGVDVARFGADRSVVQLREGPHAHEPLVYESVSNTDLAGMVAEKITEFRPDGVFIDSGRGEGVIDTLRAMGHHVVEVNFGGQAASGRYANRRAEMYAKLKGWLEAAGSIPRNHALITDLSTPEYKFDNKQRLQLESKDSIKKRGMRSPDMADALALTFAAPVQARNEFEREAERLGIARDEDSWFDSWRPE